MSLQIDFTHHAYLLDGDPRNLAQQVRDFLVKEGIVLSGNPDFSDISLESFTIDDARMVRDAQGRKTLRNARQIFLITCFDITREAQNALLKVFEEPTYSTYFFLIVPNKHILLPTLLSRFQIVVQNKTEEQNKEIEKLVQNFIESDKTKRLELIKPLIEEKKRTTVVDFLSTLEKHLYTRFSKLDTMQSALIRFSTVMKEFEELRGYSSDKGSSGKLILEYISLRLP